MKQGAYIKAPTWLLSLLVTTLIAEQAWIVQTVVKLEQQFATVSAKLDLIWPRTQAFTTK